MLQLLFSTVEALEKFEVALRTLHGVHGALQSTLQFFLCVEQILLFLFCPLLQLDAFMLVSTWRDILLLQLPLDDFFLLFHAHFQGSGAFFDYLLHVFFHHQLLQLALCELLERVFFEDVRVVGRD